MGSRLNREPMVLQEPDLGSVSRWSGQCGHMSKVRAKDMVKGGARGLGRTSSCSFWGAKERILILFEEPWEAFGRTEVGGMTWPNLHLQGYLHILGLERIGTGSQAGNDGD